MLNAEVNHISRECVDNLLEQVNQQLKETDNHHLITVFLVDLQNTLNSLLAHIDAIITDDMNS